MMPAVGQASLRLVSDSGGKRVQFAQGSQMVWLNATERY
jgi:hypothetical protein